MSPNNEDQSAPATQPRPFRYKPQAIAQPGLPVDIGRKAVPAAQLTELPPEVHDLIALMVNGHEENATIEGVAIPAGRPFTFNQACRHTGMRLRRAREFGSTPLFVTELNKAIRARQQSERARNLAVAIDIRDDEADRTAATKTVRIKAMQFIEGTDKAGTSVNVQINTNVTPGYVIKLRDRATGELPVETLDLSAETVTTSPDDDEGEGG